jgi:hypothetical protein
MMILTHNLIYAWAGDTVNIARYEIHYFFTASCGTIQARGVSELAILKCCIEKYFMRNGHVSMWVWHAQADFLLVQPDGVNINARPHSMYRGASSKPLKCFRGRQCSYSKCTNETEAGFQIVKILFSHLCIAGDSKTHSNAEFKYMCYSSRHDRSQGQGRDGQALHNFPFL